MNAAEAFRKAECTPHAITTIAAKALEDEAQVREEEADRFTAEDPIFEPAAGLLRDRAQFLRMVAGQLIEGERVTSRQRAHYREVLDELAELAIDEGKTDIRVRRLLREKAIAGLDARKGPK